MNNVNYFNENIFEDIIVLNSTQLDKYRNKYNKDEIDSICSKFAEYVFQTWKIYHKELMNSNRKVETMQEIYNKYQQILYGNIVDNLIILDSK